ncbi:hypothetical protein FLONG3_2088 [Fusarium longipes]|uniref:Apple domain-containing protein n=1 Tax=Fusarium longipes TaxID=694270 RepID=A0A395T6E2_9HYPO|nr:hypothetical protein FLONG3_2088 [Fusarium longipes]
MKASVIYLVTALLGAANVSAQCVEGTRQEISPDYIVVHKCDFYRKGTTHKKIASEIECATLAKDAGASASSYHAATKQCIVAAEGETDKPYKGATLLVKEEKKEEDPFPVEDEDPFAADCDQAKEDCLKREEQLKADLAATQAKASSGEKDLALLKDIQDSSCPKKHGQYGKVDGKDYVFWCVRYHNPEGYKEYTHVDTMAECAKYCASKSWCTYALHGTFHRGCQLYDRKLSNVAGSPGHSDYQWNCIVKA